MKKFILCLFLFVSCSPQKRLAHLIARHPELMLQTDSLSTKVPVVLPGLKLDTIISFHDSSSTSLLAKIDSMLSPRLPDSTIREVHKAFIHASAAASPYSGLSAVHIQKDRLSISLEPANSNSTAGMRLRLDEAPLEKDTILKTPHYALNVSRGASYWWIAGFCFVLLLTLFLIWVIYRTLKPADLP